MIQETIACGMKLESSSSLKDQTHFIAELALAGGLIPNLQKTGDSEAQDFKVFSVGKKAFRGLCVILPRRGLAV
jgi:hypothetical protein